MEEKLTIAGIEIPFTLLRTQEQLKAQVTYLRNKLNEHLNKVKKESAYY